MTLRRYRLGSEDILYFLHIEKTAGKTLTAILARQFAAGQVFEGDMWEYLLEADGTVKNLSAYRLFAGHFGYGLVHALPRFPVIMTVLRDPVERVISHYGQIYREYSPNWLKRNPPQSLLEFVREPEAYTEVVNLQTRYLAMDVDGRQIAQAMPRGLPYFVYDEQDGIYYHHYRRLHEAMAARPDDPALLELAKARLEALAFVGLQERFDDTVALLTYSFGWDAVTDYETRNVGFNRSELPPPTDEVIETIRERNALDVALYEYAAKLFAERYETMRREVAANAPSPLLPAPDIRSDANVQAAEARLAEALAQPPRPELERMQLITERARLAYERDYLLTKTARLERENAALQAELKQVYATAPRGFVSWLRGVYRHNVDEATRLRLRAARERLLGKAR